MDIKFQSYYDLKAVRLVENLLFSLANLYYMISARCYCLVYRMVYRRQEKEIL